MYLMEPIGKCCNQCSVWYPSHLVEVMFRRAGARDASRANSVCVMCEQTARDALKRRDRWMSKARDTRRRHADTLGCTVDDLENNYGWSLDLMARDADVQYGHNCTYCDQPYKAMGHGHSDITLDRLHRDMAPYYRSNTNWCCQTCNRKKGSRSSEWFEKTMQGAALWKKYKSRPPQLELFLAEAFRVPAQRGSRTRATGSSSSKVPSDQMSL